MDEVFQRFCTVLAQIPEGRVCSYGRLAQLAELSGPRHACQLLRRLSNDSALPWFRIVNAQGQLADFSGAIQQRQYLAREGIEFTASGRIPKRYFF